MFRRYAHWNTFRRVSTRARWGALTWSVLVVLAAAQLACAPSQRTYGFESTPTRAGGYNGWRSYDLGGGASVALPYVGRQESEQERLPDGSRVQLQRLAIAYGPTNFLVITSAIEGGVGGDLFAFLEHMLDGFLDSAEGLELIASDAVWHQGHPGTAFELRNDRGRRLVVRQYVGRSRAYTFAYASDVAQQGPTPASPQETQFFDSIRLDARDAPSPAGDGQLDYTRFQWIYPPEGGFAAELPGAPSRTETDVRFGDESYPSYTYRAQNADGTAGMRVTTIDIGAGDRPDAILPLLQSRASANGGVVRAVRPAQRQGFGGQAFVVDEATRIHFVLQVLTPNRIIEMVHTVARGDEAGQAENRRRFFNSLRVL